VTLGGATRSYDADYAQRIGEVGVGGQVALNETSQVSGGVFVPRSLGGNGGTNVRGQLSLNLNW